MLDHVTYLYGFNLRFAEMLVKDLSPEQMAERPGRMIDDSPRLRGHLLR